VRDVAHFARLVKQNQDARVIALLIQRGRMTLFLPVRLAE
jgi:hypothetical protein